MPTDTLLLFADQAIALWEQIIGRRLDDRTSSFAMTEESRAINAGTKHIKEARALGDGFCTALVVRSVFMPLADADMLPSRSSEAVKQLAAHFSTPDKAQAFEEYFNYCAKAVGHYQNWASAEQVNQFVRNDAALLNLDAYHSMQRLTRLTAMDGPPGTDTKPHLNRFVLAFDSVEHLLSHGRSMPDGFSLCAVLCASISDSYFVLVVKNGQRIILLTDKSKHSHPLQQAMMGARNDRYNMDRVTTSHFPYRLLKIKWEDRGRRAVPGDSAAVATIDSELPSIGSLADMYLDEILWLQLLIDQCRARYFEQMQVEPLLALGSHLQYEHKWLPASGRQLPALAAQALQLETKTGAELTTVFMHTMEPAWGIQKRQPNLWMERRYGAQVPVEALYIPMQVLGDQDLLLCHDGAEHTITALPDDPWSLIDARNQRVTLYPLSNDLLATREEVVRDAHFVARRNQAAVIRVLARQDYENRKNDMQEWFYKRVRKNLPNILEALLTGSNEPFQLLQPKHLHLFARLGLPSAESTNWSQRIEYRRKVQFEHIPRAKQYAPRKTDGPSLARTLGLVSLRWLSTTCVLDRLEEATVFVTLPIDNVIDVMNVTGLTWEQLPEELQYFGTPSVGGNSILERIDPLQQLSNPWDGLKIRFRVPVSLKGLKAYRKARGLSTPKTAELASI